MLAKLMPWNRFLGSLKLLKFGLRCSSFGTKEDLDKHESVVTPHPPDTMRKSSRRLALEIIIESVHFTTADNQAYFYGLFVL
jgi:hypothetical protein